MHVSPPDNWNISAAVNLKECLSSADSIRPSDPDFRVLDDGSVYPVRAFTLSGEKRSFAIQLSDSKTQTQKEIPVMLEHQKKVRKACWTFSSLGLFSVKFLPLKIASLLSASVPLFLPALLPSFLSLPPLLSGFVPIIFLLSFHSFALSFVFKLSQHQLNAGFGFSGVKCNNILLCKAFV